MNMQVMPKRVKSSILKCAFACILGVWCCPVLAQSQENGTSETGSTNLSGVRIAFLGLRSQETISNQLASAFQSQLEDLNVQLSVTWISSLPVEKPEREALLKKTAADGAFRMMIYFEFVERQTVRLYFADAQGIELARREIENTDLETTTETVGLIIRSTVNFVLQNEFLDSREEPTEEPPKEETVADSPTSLQHKPPAYKMGIDVGYAYQAIGTKVPVTNGLSASFVLDPIDLVSVWIGYRYVFPTTIEDEGARLTIQRNPVWLGAMFGRRLQKWHLRGGAAFELDITSQEKTSVSEETTAEYSGIRLVPKALVNFRVDYHLTWKLNLFLALGLSIPFQRVVYVVQTGEDTKTPILSLWSVQPLAIAGLSLALK